MTFLSEKISIFTTKNSDDFFSHRPGFSDFPFLFPDFPYLYRVKCLIYDPFFTRKTTISEKNSVATPFFTMFVRSRPSDNTTSQKIGGGGTDAWADPHLKFWGTVHPVPTRSPPLGKIYFPTLSGQF